MSCDFTTYNQLRDDTRNKALAASNACAAVETAELALQDAQAAYEASQVTKADAYDQWQRAERAENAEATRLGIDPIPTPPA